MRWTGVLTVCVDQRSIRDWCFKRAHFVSGRFRHLIIVFAKKSFKVEILTFDVV